MYSFYKISYTKHMSNIQPAINTLLPLTLKIDQKTSKKSFFQKITLFVKKFLISNLLQIQFRKSNKIPFNQCCNIIYKLNANKHRTLLRINAKFDGLCDLICNLILIDNTLGYEKDLDFIKKQVTIERLNDYKIKKGHILDIYSIFQKIIAFLFGLYPDNIFSHSDQWKLINNNKTRSVNRQILKKGLKDIKEGVSLKLEILKKSGFNFSGHSLLIKKMPNNKYAFFDPNNGEYQNLSFIQLSDHIDRQLELINGTDIFIMRGKDYLKRLEKRIGTIFFLNFRSLS